MTDNLLEGITRELERNRKILEYYKEIPQGAFGAMFIDQVIKRGEKALVSDDIVEHVRSLKELQDTK